MTPIQIIDSVVIDQPMEDRTRFLCELLRYGATLLMLIEGKRPAFETVHELEEFILNAKLEG